MENVTFVHFNWLSLVCGALFYAGHLHGNVILSIATEGIKWIKGWLESASLLLLASIRKVFSDAIINIDTKLNSQMCRLINNRI